MTYYLFRLLTSAHAIEADVACRDDIEAVRAAESLTVDFESVEVWDGSRRLALVTRGASTTHHQPQAAAEIANPAPGY